MFSWCAREVPSSGGTRTNEFVTRCGRWSNYTWPRETYIGTNDKSPSRGKGISASKGFSKVPYPISESGTVFRNYLFRLCWAYEGFLCMKISLSRLCVMTNHGTKLQVTNLWTNDVMDSLLRNTQENDTSITNT